MSSRNDSRSIQRKAGFALIAMFLVATSSQAWVHFGAADTILGRASKSGRFEVEREIVADRGRVLSADGTVLAQSLDTFLLSIRYDQVPHSPSFFLALSAATGLSAADLSAPLAAGGTQRFWSEPLTSSQAERVRAVKSHWFADGVSLERSQTRAYPFSDVTGTLVGRFEPDLVTGLERSQDSILGGVNGEQKGLADRRGAFLPMRTNKFKRATDGADIKLTIDLSLQITATQALRAAVESNRADAGVAVVMEPATGNILAAATWTADGNQEENNGFNPLVMMRYEPGSTFKILTLAKAMDIGAVSANSTIQCSGSITVNGKQIKCAHGAHGAVDPRKGIAKSCNVASVLWAQKIGQSAFRSFFDAAGLMDRPQIGLPGEVPGFYVKDDAAERLQLANFGFGQALSVTPVMLCAAYNAIANGGEYRSPQLIESTNDVPEPRGVSRRLFDEYVSDEILDFMVSTFEDPSGTAHSIRIPGYVLGGKTGTAQKLNKDWRDDRRQYVSNFVGYVPGKNPKATVLVMIDNPKAGQYYGGQVAGPVFKAIAHGLIRKYGIAKEK